MLRAVLIGRLQSAQVVSADEQDDATGIQVEHVLLESKQQPAAHIAANGAIRDRPGRKIRTDPSGETFVLGVVVPAVIVGALAVAVCDVSDACGDFGDSVGDVLAGAENLITTVSHPMNSLTTSLPIADPLPIAVNMVKSYYTRAQREAQFKATDGKCEYCQKPTQIDQPYKKDSAEGDHIVSQAAGGKTTTGNLANACRECNGPGAKGAKELGTEWRSPNPNGRIKQIEEDNIRRREIEPEPDL